MGLQKITWIRQRNCKKLAAEGASVVIADMPPAEEAVNDIRSEGGTAMAYAVNISKPDEVANLIKFAVDSYGSLEILSQNLLVSFDHAVILRMSLYPSVVTPSMIYAALLKMARPPVPYNEYSP